ncbi:hypothetical protein MKX03_016560 [Papaver bracteatum]|nr:hypothetical protein MKX03_016560 [Papaver bracteatum]
MGSSQYYINKQLIAGILVTMIYTELILLNFRMKHTGMDMRDVSTEIMDNKLLEKLYAEQI